MRITTSNTPTYPSTTLNAIPVGTVFQGTIITRSGIRTTGTFYKAYGAWQLTDKNTGEAVTNASAEVAVVQLDSQIRPCGRANLNVWCVAVENYRPAKEVELKLTF